MLHLCGKREVVMLLKKKWDMGEGKVKLDTLVGRLDYGGIGY